MASVKEKEISLKLKKMKQKLENKKCFEYQERKELHMPVQILELLFFLVRKVFCVN